MKILITGSSGFVGTNLVKKLSNKHKVVEYDLVEGYDIRDKDLLSSKLKNVDLVIHLAALISAPESWEKTEEYFSTNVMGTLKVVKSCIENNVKKLLFFSSAAAIARPYTPYGKTKKMGEEIVKLYSDSLNYLIIRPENIYGPGQKASYGYVIHNFIKSAISGEDLSVFGDGNQKRDFVYVDDVTNTVVKLITQEFDNTTVSLGTGTATKIKDLANLVISLVNSSSKVKFLEKRKEPRKSIAKTEMLLEKGIDPSNFKSLRDGIIELKQIEYKNR